MASAGQILAGRVAVIIGGDAGPLSRALKSASASVDAFAKRTAQIGAGLAGAGAGILAPLGAAAQQFASAGDEAAKMSRRTGVAVDSLGRLGHAAGLSGASTQTLEKGLIGMARGIYDAQQGVGTALPVFEQLGVNVDELAGMNPEEQFLALSEAISQIDNPSTKAAAAMKIFGRAGTQLIPLMDSGAASIRAAGKDAENLGIVFDSDAAGAAEQLTDSMDRTKKSLMGVVYSVGNALAPILSGLLDTVTGYVTTAREWIDENRELVVTVAAVGATLAVAGGAFIGLAGAASLVSTAMAGLSVALSPVGLLIGGIAVGALYLVGAFDNMGETAANVLKWIGKIRIGGTRLNTKFEEWKLGWADVFDKLKIAALGVFKTILDYADEIAKGIASIGGPGSKLHKLIYGEERVQDAEAVGNLALLDAWKKTGGHGLTLEKRQQIYDDAYKSALMTGGTVLQDMSRDAQQKINEAGNRIKQREHDRFRLRIKDKEGEDSKIEDVFEAVGIKIPDTDKMMQDYLDKIKAAQDAQRENQGKPPPIPEIPKPDTPKVPDPESVIGTFSARGAAGLSGGTRVAEQQLDTQRQMLEKLGKIADNTAGETGMVLA